MDNATLRKELRAERRRLGRRTATIESLLELLDSTDGVTPRRAKSKTKRVLHPLLKEFLQRCTEEESGARTSMELLHTVFGLWSKIYEKDELNSTIFEQLMRESGYECEGAEWLDVKPTLTLEELETRVAQIEHSRTSAHARRRPAHGDPFEANTVWGVQGRYFIPCLPVVAIAVASAVNRGPDAGP